jgi:hypothetical protein
MEAHSKQFERIYNPTQNWDMPENGDKYNIAACND